MTPVSSGVDFAPLVARTQPNDGIAKPLLIASLAIHASVLATVLLWPKPPATRDAEIPVELVQAPPPEQRAPSAPAQKPDKPPTPRREAKAEPPKKAAPAKPRQPSVSDRLKDLLGAVPDLAAVALPGSALAGTEAVAYPQLVLSKVAKAKKEGRYRGIPGYATVAFRLGDGGEIAKVELRRPSGDVNLDKEAIAMIERGAPYPAPPPGARRDYVVSLQFREMP